MRPASVVSPPTVAQNLINNTVPQTNSLLRSRNLIGPWVLSYGLSRHAQDTELAHYSTATLRLHNSISTWLIYAVDQGSPYINHRELTYRFHLFMLAIIYNAIVWPCVINILNSNFISSAHKSVLLEQHVFLCRKC